MSIENILDRISADAGEAAGEIIEKAKSEASAEAENYARESEKIAGQLRTLAEKKSAEEEKHLLVSEHLELRKGRLEKKREILDGLYEEARQKILSLGEKESAGILRALIISRAVSGNEEIIPGSTVKAIFTPKMIEDLNASFEGGASFRLSDTTGDFAWGVVLKEGRRVVDLSLDVIFEQLKEKIEPEVAVILFPDDN